LAGAAIVACASDAARFALVDWNNKTGARWHGC
jgi:hypothetical protein